MSEKQKNQDNFIPQTMCSTTHHYHYLFSPSDDALESFLKNGIRLLSDFPESSRWEQLQELMPGFYENLYKMLVQPVIRKRRLAASG